MIRRLRVLLVLLGTLAVLTGPTVANAASSTAPPMTAAGCYYSVQTVDGGLGSTFWSSRWTVNPDGCQQQSSEHCATANRSSAVWRFGGWVYSTSIASGVSCTTQDPLELRECINFRPGPGFPFGTVCPATSKTTRGGLRHTLSG